MTLSSLRAAKCRGLSEGVWGLCPRQHLRPKSRRKRRLASETPRCGSVCGCLPQQGRPFTRRVYFAEKGTLHLVGSKSAPFGTALCPSLTPLPCPSSPHRNRFAGLRWGWETSGAAPCDSRDDCDDVSDTAPALKKAVTVVTPGAVPASG